MSAVRGEFVSSTDWHRRIIDSHLTHLSIAFARITTSAYQKWSHRVKPGMQLQPSASFVNTSINTTNKGTATAGPMNLLNLMVLLGIIIYLMTAAELDLTFSRWRWCERPRCV